MLKQSSSLTLPPSLPSLSPKQQLSQRGFNWRTNSTSNIEDKHFLYCFCFSYLLYFISVLSVTSLPSITIYFTFSLLWSVTLQQNKILQPENGFILKAQSLKNRTFLFGFCVYELPLTDNKVCSNQRRKSGRQKSWKVLNDKSAKTWDTTVSSYIFDSFLCQFQNLNYDMISLIVMILQMKMNY